MRKKPVMDYSFLDKCFLVIEPKTWKPVNELLGQYGVAQEMVSTNVIRADTTVVEANKARGSPNPKSPLRSSTSA